MKIKAHQTFSVRMGWLYKGLSNVINDTETKEYSDLFISDESMNRLGLGSNMVKSLRYWMVAFGITKEKISKGQKATDFGKLVYKYDKHFEDFGTLLLCHYFLVTNKEWGTSWYYLFNEYTGTDFVKNDFSIDLINWIHSIKPTVANSSINSDVDCIIKTYCDSRVINNDENIYEDNKLSPLSELGLITQSNLYSSVYYKKSLSIESLPLEIAMFVVLRQIEESNYKSKIINLDILLMQSKSITKVFNLSTETLIKLLSKLEFADYIVFTKTSGLEQIKIKDKHNNSNYYLKLYYENLKYAK